MNMIASRALLQSFEFPGSVMAQQQGVVAIVSDDPDTISNLGPVFEFLDLKMAVVSAGTDLTHVLREQRPMAVISDVDSEEQDCFHVMTMIAQYGRDLPVLLLINGDSVLMGAADAVQELWGLTAVTQTSAFPLGGQLVAFLFSAGRKAGCMRLVPV